jgi:hypothetical protein
VGAHPVVPMDAPRAVASVARLGARLVALSAAGRLKSILLQGRRLLPALFLSSATFASIEGYRWAVLATLVLALLFLLSRFRLPTAGPVALAVCLTVWIGPVALPILAFSVLGPIVGSTAAMSSAAAVLVGSEWSSKVLLVASSSGPSVGSTFAVMLAPLLTALALCSAPEAQGRRVVNAIRVLGLGLIVGLVIWGLCEARWISADFLSDAWARFGLTFGFAVLCAPRDNGTRYDAPVFNAVLLAAMLLCGALVIALSVSSKPASRVVFDEAHGDWASVRTELGPEDFGRTTTYSWRALANLINRSGYPVTISTQANAFVPPQEGTFYVLKMPLDPIDPSFGRGLLDWVAAGGRLLVVADHTDLFDTTQNLNRFLEKIGVRVASTAVFDRNGQPPKVMQPNWIWPSWLFSSLDHRFLTGASFEALPWTTLPVQTYGLSFAEQAVYFKANRFGYFQPDLVHPFGNHLAVAMIAHGSGTVQIWLDSTHWSTFAVYLARYQDAFWQAMQRSGMTIAANIYPVALTVVSILAAIGFFCSLPSRMLVGAVAIGTGATIGATASVRLVEPMSSNDAKTVVGAIGSQATVELLAPIVESAQRNYARVFTSLQKWAPVRLHINPGIASDSSQSTLLLIDVDADDLPDASRVIEWIEQGKRVVILSDPRLLTSADQQRWLRNLGFNLRAERGLTQERDASGDLLGRRPATTVRRSVLRFDVLGSSPWTEIESTHLAQTFVLRPSVHKMVEPSGVLVLSSRSEQFSDASMGDVWDGVPVDDLSRMLEYEIARLVLGEQMLQSIFAPIYHQDVTAELLPKLHTPLPDRFIVVSQGRIQTEGRLSGKSRGEVLSLAETPDAFIWQLRQEVANFMPKCAFNAKTGYCSRTFVDSRLTEWFVVPKFDQKGRIVQLELIHEGRFSGVRDGINVLFE